MPRNYTREAPLHLYRGADAIERSRRLYGFSWTTELNIARQFANRWKKSVGGGVVLETLAPPQAIFNVRADPLHFDESEIIVDPYVLKAVTVTARIASEADTGQIALARKASILRGHG